MTMRAQDHLETLFILDARGRIFSTREPDPSRGPDFALIRRADSWAWALGTSIDDDQAQGCVIASRPLAS